MGGVVSLFRIRDSHDPNCSNTHITDCQLVLPCHRLIIIFKTTRKENYLSTTRHRMYSCSKRPFPSSPSQQHRIRPCRQSLVDSRSLMFALLFLCSLWPTVTTGFQPHNRQRTNSLRITNDIHSSWSKSPESCDNSSSSRFGVRNRVKAVLDRAKRRQTDASVVAEAAALGGLFPNSDLVVRQNGYDGGLRDIQGSRPLRNGTDVDLVLTDRYNTPDSRPQAAPKRVQVDAMMASGKVDPLPFELPQLTPLQEQLLQAGERIQEQSRMGRDGSGFVVFDVDAPDYIVWECLLDFDRYPELIGTVRSMQLFTNTHLKQSYVAESPVQSQKLLYGKASVTRASFVLSKFRLNIAAVHTYTPHPDGHFMEFSLDKANRNVVLKHAKGIWHTENEPGGRKGVTRVWLLCELSVAPVLPKLVVDYASQRAMPRATKWLKPTVLAKKQEMSALFTTTNGERV